MPKQDCREVLGANAKYVAGLAIRESRAAAGEGGCHSHLHGRASRRAKYAGRSEGDAHVIADAAPRQRRRYPLAGDFHSFLARTNGS